MGPLGKGIILIANPAKGRKTMSELVQTSGKAPKKGKKGRGRKNPSLGGIVPIIAPLATGGGIALLESRRPTWWTKIPLAVRVLVFAGVAVFARKKKMLELSGAASAWASYFLVKWIDERRAAGENTDVQALRTAADTELDAVLEDVQRNAARHRAAVGGDVGRLNLPEPESDFGELITEDVFDELDAFVQAA